MFKLNGTKKHHWGHLADFLMHQLACTFELYFYPDPNKKSGLPFLVVIITRSMVLHFFLIFASHLRFLYKTVKSSAFLTISSMSPSFMELPPCARSFNTVNCISLFTSSCRYHPFIYHIYTRTFIIFGYTITSNYHHC